MLQTDGGHMILASSHKRGQDGRKFVDIQRLRSDDIIVNNTTHVCRSHLNALMRAAVASVCCPCFIFQQPSHIETDPAYMNIARSFTHRGDGCDEDLTATKSAMLSELGILPPADHLELLGIENPMRLAVPAASQRFCSSLIRVEDYVCANPANDLVFSTDIVVYIDPTPTNVGTSFHAMAFAAKATVTNPAPGATRAHYVILAAEEFETRDIERTSQDGLRALAIVFMRTCLVLHRLYEGYFRTFYVAPEANSIHVGSFWDFCSQLYTTDTALRDAGVSILATTIALRKPRSPDDIGASDEKCRPRDRAAKRRYEKEYSTTSEMTVSKYRKRVAQEKTDEWLADEYLLENVHYRLGYALGKTKVIKMYSFFSTLYNPSNGNAADVRGAERMWAYWIARRNPGASVFRHLTDRLELLEIRPVVNNVTGTVAYKIGGKCSSRDGAYEQDDLAVATVMSVMLCSDFASNVFRGHLTRLSASE
jgi:hypothetical protein